jgi:DNA-binding NtrC family response regulator
MKRNILIVDDEPGLRQGLGKILALQGFQAFEAGGSGEARQVIRSADIDLVLLDLKLDGENGLEFLRELKSEEPLLPVIVITAYGNIKSAVDCLRAGAINYLTKPIDRELLLSVIEKEMASSTLKRDNIGLRESLRDCSRYETIESRNSRMQEIDFIVQRVRDSPATVLILGESGTGKEVMARTIHDSGLYRNRAFIGVNCAALNDNLLESELFGHEKGAFTGAVARKLGRFEMSGDGTLFLDEVGDMSLGLQAKLLRVLQERSFERVGGTKSIRTGCRVIAASNKDLDAMLAAGAFREDLYYRLSLVVIRIPALRERREDIEPLIELFIRQANQEYGCRVKGVSARLMERLKGLSWPGNIRQLKNVISNAVILSRGDTLEQIDLLGPQPSGARLDLEAEPGEGLRSVTDRYVERVERELISRALDACHRNLAQAARKLKISRKTLYEKIGRYEL